MYYETAYPSLLGGVSQQLPQDRLPGQLSTQVNMVSDLVRGLCRRPPLEFIKLINTSAASNFRLVNVSGKDLLVCMVHPTPTMELRVLDPETGVAYGLTTTPAAQTYLGAVLAATRVRSTTLGADAYIWHNGIQPSKTTPASAYQDPKKAGYFYLAAGAYSTEFSFTIKNLTSGLSYTATYTTPNGTGVGDPAASTPAAIAAALKTAMDTQLTAAGIAYTSAIQGTYVFYKATTAQLEFSSSTSFIYLRTSGKQNVKLIADLPALLPAIGDGFIVSVGTDAAPTYYRFDLAKSQWLEDAAWGQNYVITNICLKLSGTIAGYTLDVLTSEPMVAGDSVSNPDLKMATKITGIGSFKGRLVLLSGQSVCMSATNNAARWYRSTVTAVLDSDCIEIAAAVEFSADYIGAVEFSGNLLVTSARNQALIPGDVALTPRSATIAVVSNYAVTETIAPSAIGRSVLLPFDRSEGYTGIGEAIPPDSLESPLVCTDITAHIPTYLSGLARFLATSPSAETTVLGAGESVDERRTLYVHQYLWAGADKVASSWHAWQFEHPVTYAYFVLDTLYIVYSNFAGQDFLGRVKLGRGIKPSHYVDYSIAVPTTLVGDEYRVYIPAGYTMLDTITHAYSVSRGVGEVVEVQGGPGAYYVVPAANENDTYTLGTMFISTVEPTPPVFRDRSDLVLAGERIVLKGFTAEFKDSGAAQARVQDSTYDSGFFAIPIVGLFQPANIGSGILKASGAASIPARTQGVDTTLTIKTSDYFDMNLINLNYGFKLNLKHRRA